MKAILIIFFLVIFSFTPTYSQEGWIKQQCGITKGLVSVCMIDSLKAWAVGDSGTIISTNDAGEYWILQSSGAQENLLCVDFYDSQKGWIVGWNGKILHTIDGGQNWMPQNSGTQEWLYSVCFIDSLKGWAVGSHGAILNTVDGGHNWFVQTDSTNKHFRDVFFVDSLMGWIGGNKVVSDVGHRIILKTTDGGNNWAEQLDGLYHSIEAITFIDSLKGWAVTGDSIYQTLDGGEHWFVQPVDTPNNVHNLQSIDFVDSLNGWASGCCGTILHTSNGGNNWYVQRYTGHPGGWELLTSIDFVNTKIGFCVGSSVFGGPPLGNIILHTSNGGVTSIGNKSTNDVNYPNTVILSQNYPNPFNPSTTIEFTLPASEFVDLKVFNILGKEVSTPVSKKLNAGKHTYIFDGSNLASGIYYYQLMAGDYREVKKMVLLR